MSIHAYVEVDLSVFDDQCLIDELEGRSWFVGEEKYWRPNEGLTDEEMYYIASLLTQAPLGSFAHGIYEKLRKK